eukprot:CAMPEP_0203676774 /NCGR_PEP_ID=MMETSP0090-20130426/25726_1 /ASSEMBLY_ACC=CAM_ASM_001088 /TAXON_ID=426623 /ORGANISM="Chaetoceros affinis, Strain CCMP159" /LENGTH=867 /DNA_ID=CAMNT_0050543433 /DNA_START=12 /DNA_END=2615 /DNA_ORIENTATION=+
MSSDTAKIPTDASASAKDNIGHLPSVNDYERVDLLRESLKNCCAAGCDNIWMLENYDKETSNEQDLDLEVKRLEVLKSYNVLDIDTDQCFERITGLAARTFSVPIALVSIVDLGRQWFASNRGLGEVKETERRVAFCAHAILSRQDMLIVPDATKDSRFSANTLVTGDPGIRFYAGIPLVTPEGFKLGTLCIIDTKPWPHGLTLCEKQNLLELAAMVMDTIVLRKKDREVMNRTRERIIACTAHEMLTPLTSMQLNLGLMNDDEAFQRDLSKRNKELLNATTDCVALMTNICNQTIDSFRFNETSSPYRNGSSALEEVVITEVIEKIDHVISPYRKNIDISINVDKSVPSIILSNSLKIFRAILSTLINSIESAKSGSIIVNISVENLKDDPENPSTNNMLLFEYMNTSTEEDRFNEFGLYEGTARENLRVYSASTHVKALGGEFGYQARKSNISPVPSENGNGDKSVSLQGRMIWFKIPLVLPYKPEPESEEKLESTTLLDKSKNGKNISSGEKRSNPDPPDIEQSKREFFKKPRLNRTERRGKDVSEDESESSLPPLKFNGTGQRKKCALIIDDAKIIRKVFVRALTGMGFAVKQAENGLKGLLEMKTVMFDVVFCDFLMPLLDGLDCVQQYRDWEKSNRPFFKQHIIGISAHADNKDAERGLKVGMNNYMPKPISLKQLQEQVKCQDLIKATKELDKLATRADARAFCLFDNDVEITDEEHSLCASSDVESSQRHFTCLIAEGQSEVILTINRCVERKGWRVRIVRDGEDALRWMKMRNWDAIFIDDNLPRLSGHTCISTFRKWEAENRVARQRNIHMISSAFNEKNKRIPSGCDGVLGTHFTQDDIVSVLDSGAKFHKKPSLV